MTLKRPVRDRRRCLEPQEYFTHKKNLPPEDHRRTLDIVLLYGPRRGVLFMSEVILYRP